MLKDDKLQRMLNCLPLISDNVDFQKDIHSIADRLKEADTIIQELTKDRDPELFKQEVLAKLKLKAQTYLEATK